MVHFFFAFHPQIAYRFGAIVNLHYYINVTLIFLTLLFAKRFLDTHNWWFYTLACLSFTLALFTRESSIVIPAIMTLGIWQYRRQTASWAHNLYKSILVTSGFWTIALLFLALRLYLYPLSLTTTHITSETIMPLRYLVKKIPEFLVLAYDCFWLSWLPWGHKILRGGLLIGSFLLFVWLFISNRQKATIALFMLSATLMLWPAYVGHYSPRYIYEALPFLVACYLVCFTGYVGPGRKYHKIVFLLSAFPLLFFIVFTFINFKRREHKMHTIACALHELVCNPNIQNRAICLLSYPMDGLGDHPADIIRVLRKNTDLAVLCDTAGALVQADANIITSTPWCNIISNHYEKNYVSIIAHDDHVVFQTFDTNKVHFFISDHQSYSLGNKITITENNKITRFNLYIDQAYQNLNPVFVTWNYEKKKFDIVESLHKIG